MYDIILNIFCILFFLALLLTSFLTVPTLVGTSFEISAC